LWENVGVAPIYKEYKLALRLKSSQKTLVLPANANLLAWLPGDIVYDETLYVPFDIPVGKYQLQVAVVSPVSFEPRIKLAISGATGDGWYPMGNILVQDK
jgi:hypothetical protein